MGKLGHQNRENSWLEWGWVLNNSNREVNMVCYQYRKSDITAINFIIAITHNRINIAVNSSEKLNRNEY